MDTYKQNIIMNKYENILYMKNGIRLLMGALFFMFSFQQTYAQITVTGTVMDENNIEAVEVNVLVKGTSIGTITDFDGKYTLEVPEGAEYLVFSYIGYKTLEIAIQERNVIDVVLEVDITQLESVVVIGYGSQRKGDITGAVAVVNVKELGESSSTNVTDRLQGRVAGVSVKTSGEPGSIGEVTIRGASFFGNNNPLYVIDGIPTEDSPNINPADVASIQVLKDASSSTIYGSRAANGVVVITTKKGKPGLPVVSVAMNVGLQQNPNRINVVNTQEFARIHNAAYDNAGFPRRTWSDDLSRGVDTDWQDQVFNDAALLQDFNVSISGGGEKSKVYVNFNNTYQEGTLTGTLFDRLGGRINTEFDLSDRIKIGQNLAISSTRQSGQQVLDAQGVLGGSGNGIINTAVMMFPNIPVYDPTRLSGYGHGTIQDAEIYLYNPVGIREMYRSQENHTRIIGNIFLNVKIIEGLEYKFNIATDIDFSQLKSYQKGGQITTELVHLSGLEESSVERSMILYENRLTYKKEIGDHEFSVMANHTEQEYKMHQNGIIINGGYTGTNPFFQISATTASPTDITTYGDELTSTIRSFLGRLTYNYADRYLLTASVRTDGSSKFPEHNRWGTFPSVSAGWNISNENFFDVPFISNLKLRGGYGEVGNASIDNYSYQSLILSRSIGGPNYNLGYDDRSVIGAIREGIVDNNLKWETLKETNIGLDLTLLNDRLELSADYFFGELQDLLVAAPVPATAGEGGDATTVVNAATMDRSGWETSITYRKTEGDFTFNISANLSHASNKVTYLPMGDMPGLYSITRVGQPIGQIYGLDYEGIYTDPSELDDLTIVNQTPVLGDAKYRDVNGDGNISDGDDRTILGDPNPALQYGFNFSGNWKNFDFSIFFQGVHDRDAFNAVKYAMNTSPQTSYSGDYDPYIDGVGTQPRPSADFGSPNHLASSLYVEDASYLRLKNLQIGYQIQWNKVSKLRVFVGGQNLLTFTDYTGMDPEYDSEILAPGVDWGGFPNSRIYNAGLNLTF
jgi:TonB-linked SusC/RagA family outer membrane protein